ncbi:hypothetical protein B0H13DRAFT_2168018 [Mycena leptocephala]|nr:hypothetical protein B0H13DRAFT_2168018 [Mycena leptocephala]
MMMEESPVVPKGSHFTDEVTHHGRPGIFWWKERCSVKDLSVLEGFEEIPELSNTIPYDPFKIDIYQLGRTILNVIKPYPGLWLFKELGDKMCARNPDDRPTPAQALVCMDEISGRLSKRQLRNAIWRTGDALIHRITRTLCGCYLGDDHTPKAH